MHGWMDTHTEGEIVIIFVRPVRTALILRGSMSQSKIAWSERSCRIYRSLTIFLAIVTPCDSSLTFWQTVKFSYLLTILYNLTPHDSCVSNGNSNDNDSIHSNFSGDLGNCLPSCKSFFIISAQIIGVIAVLTWIYKGEAWLQTRLR